MPNGSTKRLYLHGLASSLVNLVVVSVNSLLVIRLSLAYLGKQEYGLLSLLSQVTAYISIIDLGLYVSFSRILIDYTTGTRERYANALRTASRIFHALGFLGFLIGAIIAFGGESALSIPPRLHREFVLLMLAQGISVWISFSLKPISAPLMANGKHYVVYWLNSALTIVNAVLFWLALRNGVGIYSSFLAQAVQLLLNFAFQWWMARPYRDVGEIRGVFDRSIFKEVAALARDTMLWQIGGQTLTALPIFLASAWFALDATADLSAGMKLILLMLSVCTRFGDMSATPLSIEFAKGNESAAAAQMARIAGITGGFSACAALLIICVNPAFIAWWMLDKVSLAWHANIAGALWVAILSVTQCMYVYALVCRQLNLIRWAMFAECLIYIAFALAFRSLAGSASLLWAKPLATLMVGIGVAVKLRKHTRFDARLLLPVFLRQAAALALLIPSCLFVIRWLGTITPHPLLNFIGSCLLACAAGLTALPLLFTREMRADLYRVMHGLLARFRPPKSGAASLAS